VVTQEIGDTWIHGTGSDPAKLAAFRQLCRLRVRWLSQRKFIHAEAKLDSFSRYLLMVAEHTWGMDNKTHLADCRNYATRAFAAVRHRSNYQMMERSWQEQRDYIRMAVDALPSRSLQHAARKSLRELRPVMPSFGKSQHCDTIITNKALQVAVDPAT